MTKRIAILAAAMLIAAPALGETISEKTGVNSALNIAPSTADFVAEATISNMFEIQSSKLAEDRSDDATKAFATKMIADHTKISSAMGPIAKSANVPVPMDMDSAHKDMLAKLQSLTGEAFTKRYHDDQETAHKQAVSLFERYGKGGDNPALKQFASTTLPTLEQHEKMADNLDK